MILDGGDGGLRLRKDHREEEDVGTREEEEEENEEEDLEEGTNRGEPAFPLEKLEKSAQTSSSSCLILPWGGKKWGTRDREDT